MSTQYVYRIDFQKMEDYEDFAFVVASNIAFTTNGDLIINDAQGLFHVYAKGVWASIIRTDKNVKDYV
jgi:hypothetical protein